MIPLLQLRKKFQLNKTNVRKSRYKNLQFTWNLLHEESMGFIPDTLRGMQGPRYIFTKFCKDLKTFDFTDKDILKELDIISDIETQ